MPKPKPKTEKELYLELFYAVDEFLEYPGAPSRKGRLMHAALDLAQARGKTLNNWCPSPGWLPYWPPEYVGHNADLRRKKECDPKNTPTE